MKAIIQSIGLEKIFPQSDQLGESSKGVNQTKIRMLSKLGHQPKAAEVRTMLEAHYEFLRGGGAGGQWKVLQIGDLVIGFYDKEITTSGKQAIFERMNLEKVEFECLEFPFANFCGAYAVAANFKRSNLSYSLFTDATLQKVTFEEAYLKQVDFSRSDLSGACFRKANLSGADFENCNLQGADFRGAKFDTARFPGANLNGVLY